MSQLELLLVADASGEAIKQLIPRPVPIQVTAEEQAQIDAKLSALETLGESFVSSLRQQSSFHNAASLRKWIEERAQVVEHGTETAGCDPMRFGDEERYDQLAHRQQQAQKAAVRK
ncbi:MAG: hypothetical protein MHM6MM_002543 [Cercozoa sp. M6MM]